jgi:hypothetical protein
MADDGVAPRKRRAFSDADIDRLIEMRDVLKMRWRAIGVEFGDTASNCCWRYKYYTDKRRLEGLREGEPLPPRRTRTWSPPTTPNKPCTVMPPPKAKPVVIAKVAVPNEHRPRYFHEADADIAARIDRQGITAGLLGDPPAGRSALDQKRDAGV